MPFTQECNGCFIIVKWIQYLHHKQPTEKPFSLLCNMFKYPSYLEQQCATCLTQIFWNSHVYFLLTSHIPKLGPNSHPIITLNTLLHKVKSPTGSRTVTWTLYFWGHSVSSISWGKCSAGNSQARWAELHFNAEKLLSTNRDPRPHMVWGAIVLHPIHIIRADRPIYTSAIWHWMSEHSGMNVCI